ncbi:MAG: hypothetical protein WC253_01660 [Sulfurovaceae bacterium]|nr:hypothetical protein [Sulfurovaceae bacterium]
MKSPRGFGKRYFTLASILAYTVFVKLQKSRVQISSICHAYFSNDLNEEEDPPPLSQIQCLLLLQNPTLCNCIFTRIAKQALLSAKKRKKCNCRNLYFSFRRSGTHPPLSFHIPTTHKLSGKSFRLSFSN